ncbi:MAG TPA: hypothetical protein VLK24_08660 [Gaiellaceae bacterium]|nr:hypothetical protein [Gaiellaceae bacterium]
MTRMTTGLPAAAPGHSERIRRILEDLVRHRQSLRRDLEHDRPLLQANRRSIVYWQGRLAQALLEEHGGAERAGRSRAPSRVAR